MSKIQTLKNELAAQLKTVAANEIIPASIKAIIDQIEEYETECAKLREMIEFQRESMDWYLAQGNIELANKSDMLIERLWARVAHLEGEAHDWDELVA